MPNGFQRRKLYYHIHEYLTNRGFERVSVWGFKRADRPRYSSVTRDGYLGLGAGAGSHLPDGFYLNTFSVEEYVKRCKCSQLPVALHMAFNSAMQNYFWLYWRLYDTYIPKEELFSIFGRSDRKLYRLIEWFKWLRLLDEHNDSFTLTRSGAFWVHLLQNYFSLRYIDKIWGTAMKEAFPAEITL